jgi:hypothetical protein
VTEGEKQRRREREIDRYMELSIYKERLKERE